MEEDSESGLTITLERNLKVFNYFNNFTVILRSCNIIEFNSQPHNQKRKNNQSKAMTTCRGSVALVLLAEAHVTMAVALCHTSMIDHEEVNVEIVSTCPPDLVMLC